MTSRTRGTGFDRAATSVGIGNALVGAHVEFAVLLRGLGRAHGASKAGQTCLCNHVAAVSFAAGFDVPCPTASRITLTVEGRVDLTEQSVFRFLH